MPAQIANTPSISAFTSSFISSKAPIKFQRGLLKDLTYLSEKKPRRRCGECEVKLRGCEAKKCELSVFCGKVKGTNDIFISHNLRRRSLRL